MRRLVVATAFALAATVTSAFTASAATRRFDHYVSLGDSYTAGPFIPLARLDPLGCMRSTSNYPAQLAARLRVRSFTDVSCSGTDTSNMASPQSVTFGTNPPQLDALKPDTNLVTVGIGGNDFDVFGSMIGTCPALRASDPTGNPCQRAFTVDGVDTIKARLAHTRNNIAAVLTKIHARAPHAKVLAVGYPRIAPPSGSCPDVLPFADGDYAWLNSVEEGLNEAVSAAATADGKTSYVDTFTPSLGHDACAADPWVNGQHNNMLAAAAYHPFFAGMKGIARAIYTSVR
jgi:GDSL-like lipase/acylhydrolase family protein